MKNIFNTQFNIFFILILIPIYIGCNFNILDQSPVDSFNEETLFSDINLVEAFLFQCYDNMGGDRDEVLGMRGHLLSTSTDELLNLTAAGQVTFTKGTLSPDFLGHFGSYRFSWIQWDANYSNIKNINTLLAGIDNVPITSNLDKDKINLIKAESYFLRAFNYTNLLRSYGGVVLIDNKFDLKDDFLSFERSDLQATLDFILEDLDKAISNLPDKSKIEQGRATKGAAAALKSRLLSFVTGELMNGYNENSNKLVSFQDNNREERLRNAKNIAKEIIDGKYGYYELSGPKSIPPINMTDDEFSLYVENYSNVFLQKGSWNDEVMFGVQYLNKQGNKTNFNLYTGPNGYNNYGNNGPIESTVRAFEMRNGEPFKWDKYNTGELNIREFTSKELELEPELNPFEGREARFYANILYDGAPWRERPSTNNKVQIASTVNAPGAKIMGSMSVSAKMNEINKLSSVTIGGEDSRQASNQAWNGTKTGYYLRKMLDITIDGEVENNENAWIEIRFAEVLLDYAEACIELGEIEEGIKTLNKIRHRAGLPGRELNTSQDQAREWYRHERFIEMLAEGDRWYMIRKWMIAEDVIKDFHPMYIYHFNDGVSMFIYNTTTLADDRKWNNKNYWLPISRTEINKAPQLQQNPGY